MNKKKRNSLIPHWLMGLCISFGKYKIELLQYNTGIDELFMLISNINFISGDGDYCIFHLIVGDDIRVHRNLGFFLDLLPANHFGRFHNGYIMNYHCISMTNNLEGCMAMMMNDEWCAISRRETEVFLETYGRFVKFKGIIPRRK